MRILLLFFLFLPNGVAAQLLYDQRWLQDNFNHWDFSGDTVVITKLTPPLNAVDPGRYTTSTCDAQGNLLMYTNGCYLYNRQMKQMPNGDTLNAPDAYPTPCDYSVFYFTQSNLTVPYPGDSTRYVVFNLTIEETTSANGAYVPKRLYYHVVDMTLDNGLGDVVLKRQEAIVDELSRGSLTAVLSPDLQKIWVVVPQRHTNCYYFVPITAAGVGQPWLQCIGAPFVAVNDGGGQAVFSPDKTKYARSESKEQLVLFDFDTATAAFSNPLVLPYQSDYQYLHGVAFSDNSRYLYVFADTKIYQFDTDAPDVAASGVLVGEIDFNHEPGTGGVGLAKLAPDGKIYIPPANFHYWISTIQRPNCPGTLCDFRQHNVYLPGGNYAGINNQPSYRVYGQQYDCEPVSAPETGYEASGVGIWPNPGTGGRLEVGLASPVGARVRVLDVSGRVRHEGGVPAGVYSSALQTKVGPGLYVVEVRLPDGGLALRKWVVY